jgi:hypothetical protein
VKAFEIYLNGRHLLTAGIGDVGVLATTITWAGRPAQPGPLGLLSAHTPGGSFDFHVGGLDPVGDVHLDWSVPEIGVGDEITVRIVETDRVSPIHSRHKGEEGSGGSCGLNEN